MGETVCSLSISRLSSLLARGEVSPVEVTEAMLTRIKERDGELNTYITVDEAGARAMAREAEAMLAPGRGHPADGGAPGPERRHGHPGLEDHLWLPHPGEFHPPL